MIEHSYTVTLPSLGCDMQNQEYILSTLSELDYYVTFSFDGWKIEHLKTVVEAQKAQEFLANLLLLNKELLCYEPEEIDQRVKESQCKM